MGANVTCTHKFSELAHGNGHAAIRLRIGQDQFRLLNWTTCFTGHGHMA